MRRQVKRIAVCVVVGVVVNVAVAWGCVLATRSWPVAVFQEQPVTAWNFEAPAWWPLPDYGSVRHQVGVSHRWLYIKTTDSPSREFETHGIGAGLPFRSLQSVWAYAWELEGSNAGAAVEPVMEYATSPFLDGMALAPLLDRGDLKDTLLPIMPIWSGFVANTLVYGAIVWGMLFAPRAVRRWRRKKRGACDGCGYELAGLVRCPECGAKDTEKQKNQKE